MGRWSARLAPLFAAFAGIRSGERVLDVGCGTGILSRALIDLAPNIEVIGIDPAASYVDWACRSLRSPRVRFQVGTAEALAFTDAAFDAALALLVVQELADPPRAVREMARVTRRGGYVAACKWDFGNGLPMLSLFWQAAEAVSPDAVGSWHHHGVRFFRGFLVALPGWSDRALRLRRQPKRCDSGRGCETASRDVGINVWRGPVRTSCSRLGCGRSRCRLATLFFSPMQYVFPNLSKSRNAQADPMSSAP